MIVTAGESIISTNENYELLLSVATTALSGTFEVKMIILCDMAIKYMMIMILVIR